MILQRLALLLGIGLLVVTLVNGSVPFLKRVGWIEPQNHAALTQAHCRDGGGDVRQPCWCMPETGSMPGTSGATTPLPGVGYVYKINGGERFTKLAKDLMFVGFALVSLWLLARRQVAWPRVSGAWPVLALVVGVGLGFVISLATWSAGFALTGLRSFAFLAVALLGGWAAMGLPMIARWVGWLLIAQLLLVGIEAWYGIPLRSCPHSSRMAGALVLPNSLGVFAVVALAFVASFLPGRLGFVSSLVVVVALLLASGSGTGLVALVVLLCYLVIRRLHGNHRWVAVLSALALTAGLAATLPHITSRPDIYDSVFAKGGRIDTLQRVLDNATPREQWLGRGVGYGTNSATNLGFKVPLPVADAGPDEDFHADSTVTGLLTQLGMVGVLIFYALLLWAVLRDVRARPFYLVLGLASLAMNVTELFPVSFLLGLVLAHTVFVGRLGENLDSA